MQVHITSTLMQYMAKKMVMEQLTATDKVNTRNQPRFLRGKLQ